MNPNDPAKSSYSSPLYGYSLKKVSEPNPGLQLPYFEDVFSRRPIYDIILSCLDIADLIRLGRTSKVARAALAEHSIRAYNINRHLRCFFDDPLSFRSLQARTGSLISGSNALQFLDRSFYPGSDLDVYVHPGHTLEVGNWLMNEEGYTFVPKNLQELGSTFEENVEEWDPFQRRYNEEEDASSYRGQVYRFSGVFHVYSFEKKEVRKVQIVEARESAFTTILSFHSTCVMNLISFDTAYSLYPRATFKERRMQLMREITPEEVKAISKYGRRGFQIAATYLWPYAGSDPCLVLDTVRNVNDRFTWRVALDTTGVDPRSKLTPTSNVMKTDPVVQNTWEMCHLRGDNLTITYFAVKSTLLRYNYVVAENDYLLQLVNWLRVQGFYEHEKVEGLSGEEKINAWTWCVYFTSVSVPLAPTIITECL
ncbi:uncharacterized protein STEHIDRAFT_61050 [Stereum hirsutum FP-91666 SS1]|uniref:uncharacterized protein n=1 Tax=Stereum hirsutum (strain FP-91666) TaxID=721885 RepID=UPI000444A279|nr:uncharacterized protein STEHIDRAFT_61050 [Stereum hirsutum FP-91666 SS1]EIM84863.1 hypothetical protein STEHIDRAFT_61050 [Stereum hirsutum FP-91666 SS1]